MHIRILTPEFTVCKVERYPADVFTAEYCFIGKTDEENSLVCPTDLAPADAVERSDGWRAFAVTGTLDFSLVGILARISSLLANAGIGIFAVSTYNTDYILVKKENLARAVAVLAGDGITEA